jgi:hypothetical protein
MSAGARPDTTLILIEAEFTRLTGLGLFHFPAWYAEQMRALRASMDWRFPIRRADQEKALLDIVRARP